MKAFRLKELIGELLEKGYVMVDDGTSMTFNTSEGELKTILCRIEFYKPKKEVLVATYNGWTATATTIDMDTLNIINGITKELGWLDA